jgi:undecaprenyl-diphosphatase
MLKYIFLGILQGLTEFLPVSSSGHLLIAQKILGLTSEGLAISIILHLGTAIALIIFFLKDILKMLRNAKLMLLIIIVTAITGVIGVSGKDFFEGLFSSTAGVAVALVFTGIILILTKKFMHAQRKDLRIKDALVLGLTQGIAIIPGISRSGITISTLLFRKVDRETSFRFSFLASIPAVLGATILEAKKVSSAFSFDIRNFALGFIFSLLTGICSLWILKIIINKAKLHYFGYYCIFAAIMTLLFVK